MEILRFKTVSKQYASDSAALQEVSFTITPGEFTALAGPSGSGKTTILNLAAGLDKASSGDVMFLGNNLTEMAPAQIAQLRRSNVGFVFQAYNLFTVLTAGENVEYPLALNQVPRLARRKLVKEALEDVGLGEFVDRIPSKLSGGQQQRVAIARAIVCRPKIVFADEPTANLDSTTADKLLVLFRELNEKKGITFLFSSHDPRVLSVAKRILQVGDGKITKDSGGPA